MALLPEIQSGVGSIEFGVWSKSLLKVDWLQANDLSAGQAGSRLPTV